MESICSSETSVDTQRITRLYIPEGGRYSSKLFTFEMRSLDNFPNEKANMPVDAAMLKPNMLIFCTRAINLLL
jgi:hypothetical protein